MVTARLEKFTTEEAFYQRQGLDYIPPEIREGQHEIEIAEKGMLPRLIEISDIKGDLHIHSNWSDGNAVISDIAAAAQARGYRYIAITDHSIGLGIAHGLDVERVRQQIQEIQEFNQKSSSIHVLTGMEVDIRADGTLDMPDELLAELDIVIASVHSAMNQSEEQMTRRVITAIENPHIDILGHPTCRLLGEREPIELNIEAVFQAAIKNNTVMEIDSIPSRLDLKDTHIYQAREMGVKLVIDTDSHRLEHLDYMNFGIGTARRGWCEAGDILNTLPLNEFKAALKK
jgi:DNA polymerase (family 10)